MWFSYPINVIHLSQVGQRATDDAKLTAYIPLFVLQNCYFIALGRPHQCHRSKAAHFLKPRPGPAYLDRWNSSTVSEHQKQNVQNSKIVTTVPEEFPSALNGLLTVGIYHLTATAEICLCF